MTQANQRGIAVLGSPRSGTTLLRRILDAHPNITSPGETHLFGAAARFLQADQIGEGLPVGVVNGLGYLGFEEREVLDRLRSFVFSFLDDYTAKKGAQRWAEKTAFHAFHIPAIETLLGDRVVYVAIVRHGLDVVVSMNDFCERVGGYLPELHEYVVRNPVPLEAFAHAWSDSTRGILDLAARRPDDVHLLEYEELVSEPEKVVRELFEFLGEPWHPEVLEAAFEAPEHPGFSDWKTFQRDSVHHDSVGRWPRLPRPVINRLAEIANPVLEAAGYEAVPVRRRAGADEARRYEIGLLSQRVVPKRDDGGDS
ncbi:MAG: sulfotransferase [bacterium]|nr:sulfotransferase [bacterium]